MSDEVFIKRIPSPDYAGEGGYALQAQRFPRDSCADPRAQGAHVLTQDQGTTLCVLCGRRAASGSG